MGSEIGKVRAGIRSNTLRMPRQRGWQRNGPLDSGLGVGLAVGLIMPAVLAALRLELLKLLLLLVVQDGFNLRLAVLHDGLRLGAAVGRSQRRIAAQGLHLLDAVGKNGLDLRHLVLAQVQLLGQSPRLPFGVGLMHTALRSRCGLRGVGLAGIRGLLRLGLRKRQAGREQRAEEESCRAWITYLHNLLFSLPAGIVLTGGISGQTPAAGASCGGGEFGGPRLLARRRFITVIPDCHQGEVLLLIALPKYE